MQTKLTSTFTTSYLIYSSWQEWPFAIDKYQIPPNSSSRLDVISVSINVHQIILCENHKLQPLLLCLPSKS